MSIQLIWKRRMTNEVPLLFRRLSIANSMLPSLAFYAKPHKNFAIFCTEIAAPSATPDRGVATEFLINKCGLTDAESTKVVKRYRKYKPSSQNMEEVLELLNGCGLTTLAQIRKVTRYNPQVLFCRSSNVKSKLSLFRTFMKEGDIAKLVYTNASALNTSVRTHKSAILLIQKMGIEGEALSDLLARQPRLLTTSNEKVMKSFKQAEDLGFKKGSRVFARALRAILGQGQEITDRRRQCLSSLGFSENQISGLCRKMPAVLSLTEEKIKRNVDFVINIAGLPLADLVKHPSLFTYSVERRMIPRYRVMEALKSTQLEVPKKNRLSFPHIVMLTEKRFLERYVHSNAESSSPLLDIYHGRREVQ